MCCSLVLCFKQKTAYEMRISDWSSDVCSSDLGHSHKLSSPVAANARHYRDRVRKPRGAMAVGMDRQGRKKPHPSTGLFPSSAVVTKGSPINSHEGRIGESLYREPRLIHERVER